MNLQSGRFWWKWWGIRWRFGWRGRCFHENSPKEEENWARYWTCPWWWLHPWPQEELHAARWRKVMNSFLFYFSISHIHFEIALSGMTLCQSSTRVTISQTTLILISLKSLNSLRRRKSFVKKQVKIHSIAFENILCITNERKCINSRGLRFWIWGRWLGNGWNSWFGPEDQVNNALSYESNYETIN